MDAVLLVFSLESEDSFSRVCSYYNRMCSFRNMIDVPKVLVGVQGNMFASFMFKFRQVLEYYESENS